MDIGLLLYGGISTLYGIGLFILIFSYQGADKFQNITVLSGAYGVICFQIANYLKSAGNAEKLTKVDAKVDTSIVASQENAQTLAASTQQQAQATEGIAQQVDGHMTAMREDLASAREEQRTSSAAIATLTQEVASLKQAAVVKQAGIERAESSEQRIIAAGKVNVADAAALAPPVVDP